MAIARSKMFDQHVIPQALASTPHETPQIHILGLGNIGKLFAHSLARISPRPRITIILHRTELVQPFKDSSCSLNIITDGISNSISDFDFEAPGVVYDTPITNIIVATKATTTLSALSGVRARLNRNSNIVFAQNGKGTVEEVTSSLFPDPKTRPAYLQTVVFHGIHATGPFESIHAGVGHVCISAPTDRPQVRYLMDSIVAAPVINAMKTSEDELLLIQLEKLVINVMLNPLTAIFRILNGDLFRQAALEPLWQKLVEEAAEVLTLFMEKEGIKGAERFRKELLYKDLRAKGQVIGKNRSSMLQDVEAGRETEITYINGWIIAKGKELGASVEMNEKVVKCLNEGTIVGIDSRAVKKEFGEFADFY